MIHHEVHDTALGSALEALVAVTLWIYHERTDVPVIVERAEPQVSDTFFLQVNEVANDLLNLRGVQNLLDDEFVDSFAHKIVF